MKTDIIRECTINKCHMRTIELQSLHNWFKGLTSQCSHSKCKTALKMMLHTTCTSTMLDIEQRDIQLYQYQKKISCINLHDKILERIAFEHWKIYVIHKLRKLKFTKTANNFYTTLLQRRVLNVLSKNVLLKWQYIVTSMYKRMSAEFSISENCFKSEACYANVSLRFYFVQWSRYIKMKHRKHMLNEKAVALYKSHLLKKCILNWRAYVVKRKRKEVVQKKLDEACKFWEQNILRKYIKYWIYIFKCSSVKIKQETAVKHYGKKLIAKYFNSWITYYDGKTQKVAEREYAKEFLKKKLLKRYFKHLVMYVHHAIDKKAALQKADMFCNTVLVQKTFSAWRNWYCRKLQNSIKLDQFKRDLENEIQHTVFIKWKLYVFWKKCTRRKIFLLENLCKKKLMAQSFKKFQNYVSYKKDKRDKIAYLDNKAMVMAYRMQSMYIEKWTKALYIRMQEKRKLSEAIEFWEKSLSRKYMCYWKEFSKKYKIKMIRKSKLNELAANFLLKKFILIWHNKYQQIVAVHKKENIIISIFHHKVMKKYLLYWRKYKICKVKKRNDLEAAIELHKQFLLREGLKEMLRNCLRNLDCRYEIQLEHTALKSLQWFEIMKEFFDKWRSLMYLKKKAKSLQNNINNNGVQFTDCKPDPDNMIFNNVKDTYFMLPEYMKNPNVPIISRVKILPDFSSPHFPPYSQVTPNKISSCKIIGTSFKSDNAIDKEHNNRSVIPLSMRTGE